MSETVSQDGKISVMWQFERRRLVFENGVVIFSLQQAEIVNKLWEREGQTVERNELLALMNPDSKDKDALLSYFISKIKEKLKSHIKDPDSLIYTMTTKGFLLNNELLRKVDRF